MSILQLSVQNQHHTSFNPIEPPLVGFLQFRCISIPSRNQTSHSQFLCFHRLQALGYHLTTKEPSFPCDAIIEFHNKKRVASELFKLTHRTPWPEEVIHSGYQGNRGVRLHRVGPRAPGPSPLLTSQTSPPGVVDPCAEKATPGRVAKACRRWFLRRWFLRVAMASIFHKLRL